MFFVKLVIGTFWDGCQMNEEWSILDCFRGCISYRDHYFTVYCLCFSGYLNMFCKLLKDNLDKMPGDLRTQIGFITFNSTVHFYSLKVGDFHITGLY